MTIHTFPDLGDPSMAEWDLVTQTQEHISPLDNSVQTRELPGARLSLEVSYPPLLEARARLWVAFKARIGGAAGRFYMGPQFPFDRPQGYYDAYGDPDPEYIDPGAILVDGDDQLGRNLAVKNCTPNATLFRIGDYVSVDNAFGGRQMFVVTEDIESASDGTATLVFAPPLRRSPLDNTPVVFMQPTCIMRMINDEQGKVTFQEARQFGLTLSLIEVFPP